jgi:hypothetical protein
MYAGEGVVRGRSVGLCFPGRRRLLFLSVNAILERISDFSEFLIMDRLVDRSYVRRRAINPASLLSAGATASSLLTNPSMLFDPRIALANVFLRSRPCRRGGAASVCFR